MKIRAALPLGLALWAAAAVSPAAAVEGKWTPEQVLQHDAKWLRSLGLEIPPRQLWSPDGGGLLEAAVKIEGCSAGFISARGLLITNHHCAFSILQQHSTPARDLITHGFLARSPAEELAGAGLHATLPHRMTDVTAQIEAAAAGAHPADAHAGGDDLARFRAIERREKELVAACEGAAHHRCQVAAFDGGVRYTLIDSLEFPDVRLVYAPPRAVGEYGGETDNWSWPRHTGDFALLRVYAGPGGEPADKGEGNVPYRPRHFFPVAPRGIEPDAFVMVPGYPGLTFRSFTEAEMRERAELFYPRRSELYARWIERMEAASQGSEGARIALADRMKGLANQEKNGRGQVAGIRRGQILERKAADEREVLAWAGARADQRPALAAHDELARLVAERRRTWERDFLLNQMRFGPKPLDLALTLARWAGERAKPDLEREPDFQERNRQRLGERLEREQKRMDPAAEADLLADVLGRFAALPEGSRVPAVDALLAGARSPEEIRARADGLLAHTRVTDLEERRRMFAESAADLAARHDPLLDLGLALDAELRGVKEREDRFLGAVSRLRPLWQRAVIAHAGRPLAPDANGTLRVSFAHVRGYSPRDGVFMRPQTTLAGVVEKNTGAEPFAAPPELLAAADSSGGAAKSRWADPALHDVPVDFLADADTTGGNSGSPVVNGRGELVGVNFDRVWENVANDFGYNPEVARNVSVDVRYLLWMLQALDGDAARPLLQEMLPGKP